MIILVGVKENMRKIILSLIVAGLSYGQQINVNTLQLQAPPPSAVFNQSAFTTGVTGQTNLCYWVVAVYNTGMTIPNGPFCVTNSNATLTGGNFNTITWQSPASTVIGYWVVRSGNSVFPGTGTTAVNTTVLASSVRSQTDQSNTLHSFTFLPASGAVANESIDNQTFTQPVIKIDTPVNTTLFANLPSAASAKNLQYLITDATTASTCNAGGGTNNAALCWSNGTTWIALGGGGGGSGITQLTGDVTAGPGTGSQVATLATVNSSPGACGDSTHVCVVTTNGKGLVTSQTATAISAGGTGTVTVSGGGAVANNAIVTGAGTTVIQTPSTTATMDSSGNISTPGTVSTGNAGGVSGAEQYFGGTSGSTKWGAAAVAGTPNDVNYPIATGAAGTILSTNGANPQQLSWVVNTISCQPGLGDGLNAIAAGTYLQSTCFNLGTTFTITSVSCFTDNAGTSTLNITNGASTGLLTGAITCNATFPGAAGTQSGTTTIAANDGIKFTFVADGTSKQTTWVVTGHR